MGRSIGFAACGLALAVAFVASAQIPSAPEGAARELPSAVFNAFQKAYPVATISTVSPERQDGKLAFRLDCLDKGRRRVLVYDVYGGVIEVAEQVDEKDLPQPVAAAIHANRKAGFAKGMKITRAVTVVYEVTLGDRRKTTMVVKPDGAVVSVK